MPDKNVHISKTVGTTELRGAPRFKWANWQSLLFKFFMALLTNPTHRDWVSQVLQELEDLNMILEIEEIELLSKEQYKLDGVGPVDNRPYTG